MVRHVPPSVCPCIRSFQLSNRSGEYQKDGSLGSGDPAVLVLSKIPFLTWLQVPLIVVLILSLVPAFAFLFLSWKSFPLKTRPLDVCSHSFNFANAEFQLWFDESWICIKLDFITNWYIRQQQHSFMLQYCAVIDLFGCHSNLCYYLVGWHPRRRPCSASNFLLKRSNQLQIHPTCGCWRSNLTIMNG